MQHNLKGQLESAKIVREQTLTINQLISMSYQHITSDQRNELSALLRANLKRKDVAKVLRKHRSSIWRELKRNPSGKEKKKYNARQAKTLTKKRRIKANSRFRKLENNSWLRYYVVKKIKKYWSPEQIAGRLKKQYPLSRKKWIGKDSIYQFIYDKRPGLVKYLRCQKGKYRRRYGTRIRERQREALKKRRIDTRPEIVELKQRIGDWEGDTMIGQDKKPAILNHTERKSGLILADKLERATKETTSVRLNFSKITKNPSVKL